MPISFGVREKIPPRVTHATDDILIDAIHDSWLMNGVN